MTKPTKQPTKPTASATAWLESDELFWGLLLVAIGTLFLLHNIGVLTLYVGNIWQLWPIIIILFGVSFLQLKGGWNALLNVTATVVISLLLVFTLTSEHGLRQGPITHEGDDVVAVEKQGRLWRDIESASVHVNSGAISLHLGSLASGDAVAAADLAGSRKITEETRVENNVQHINFGTKGHPGFGVLQGKNRLNLHLSQRLPIDLTLDMGASTIRGDLSKIQLRNLAIDAGASSVNLTLGAKQERTEVTIDSGASNVTLRLPSTAAYSIERKGGLTSGNFAGAEKVSDNRYETEDFADASHKIIIKASTGATVFTIEQY